MKKGKKLLVTASLVSTAVTMGGCRFLPWMNETPAVYGPPPDEYVTMTPVPGEENVTGTRNVYTYEELSEMSAKELLDLFIQNGLVISDEMRASFTEEELQNLFKENFHLWHTGVSAHSYTMYIDLAEQTKVIYDKIAESKN